MKVLLGSYIILLSSIFYKNITLTTVAHCINVSGQSIIIYSFLMKTLHYKQYTR